jgi:hypothetical protein
MVQAQLVVGHRSYYVNRCVCLCSDMMEGIT